MLKYIVEVVFFKEYMFQDNTNKKHSPYSLFD